VLFTHYQDNTKKALMTIYHEYKWDEPRFDLSPQAYWDSLAENGDTHIKSYLEHVAKQLNVQKADDWCVMEHTCPVSCFLNLAVASLGIAFPAYN
jgi:hypothetical protein